MVEITAVARIDKLTLRSQTTRPPGGCRAVGHKSRTYKRNCLGFQKCGFPGRMGAPPRRNPGEHLPQTVQSQRSRNEYGTPPAAAAVRTRMARTYVIYLPARASPPGSKPASAPVPPPPGAKLPAPAATPPPTVTPAPSAKPPAPMRRHPRRQAQLQHPRKVRS